MSDKQYMLDFILNNKDRLSDEVRTGIDLALMALYIDFDSLTKAKRALKTSCSTFLTSTQKAQWTTSMNT